MEAVFAKTVAWVTCFKDFFCFMTLVRRFCRFDDFDEFFLSLMNHYGIFTSLSLAGATKKVTLGAWRAQGSEHFSYKRVDLVDV